MFKFDFEAKAQKWDVQYGFRRPANFQHLSSYQTLLRLSKDYGIMFFYLALTLCASAFLTYSVGILFALNLFSTTYPLWLGGLFGLVLIWAAFSADRASIFWAYRKELQRETYGSSRWADAEHLESKNLLAPLGECPEKSVAIARFQRNKEIVLPLDVLAQGVGLVGPPGSGKTATIILSVVRQFAKHGGMLAVDPKGELYQYSAYNYNSVYRFDLENPQFSDYFDLFGACRGNAVLAGKVAHYLMSSGGKAKDPIWEMAATGMIKALILHLCEILEHPTPLSVFAFLEANPAKAKKRDNAETGKEEWYYPLHEAMSNSPSEEARVVWGASFSQIAKETFGSIIFQMFSNLEIFTDPKVQVVLRPPTNEEKKMGRRKIDFNDLRKMFTENGRKTGCGMYIVVPEGEMERLKRVISCFLAIADDILRSTGGDGDDIIPVLTMYEEAGNCPPPGLQEKVNVGRGRKMYNFLCYQNISQPAAAYGKEVAQAILESLGTLIFLPGTKGENAEYAVRMMEKTTVLQKSTRDAVGNAFDSENASETGRNLMNPDELRRMSRYTQMIIINNDAFPIRARFSDNQKIFDARVAEPVLKTILKLNPKDEKAIRELSEKVSSIKMTPDNFQKMMGMLDTYRNSPVVPENRQLSDGEYTDGEIVEEEQKDIANKGTSLLKLPDTPIPPVADGEESEERPLKMTNQSNFSDGTVLELDEDVAFNINRN